MTRLLLAGVEVDGAVVDVRVRDGVVREVRERLRPGAREEVIDGRGGALLPGLHDHHLHLLSLAAAASSVRCGPPQVTDRAGLQAALLAASLRLAPGAWVRGTAYAESVAGALDRYTLDSAVADRPVRVQHRGGALWVLNSCALEVLGLEGVADADVERDGHGTLTGRLWRWDAALRERLPAHAPDLAGVGEQLAAFGVTGVTDATPDLDTQGWGLLEAAVAAGTLPPGLLLLGAPDAWPGAGAHKLMLRDHDLPSLDDLVDAVRQAHAAGRPVAVHVVTRVSLLLTLAALQQAGTLPGDRLEHAAVVPRELCPWVRSLGLRVVTQPVLLADRGEDYRREVDPHDVDCLYPYASLVDAGVQVAPSSDAPFGDLDPWRGLAAAVSRTTTAARVLGAAERVDPAVALAGYLSPLDDPGGPARRVEVGLTADLCLLDVPLGRALAEPAAEHVRAAVWGGLVRYGG